MPYKLAFEKKGRGVVLTFTGSVDGDELYTAVREIYQSDRRRRLQYQIADFSDSTRFDVDEEQLRGVAFLDQQAARHYPQMRLAIVGSDAYFNGADRRYAIYTEVWAGFDSRAFSSIEAARNWIEIE